MTDPSDIPTRQHLLDQAHRALGSLRSLDEKVAACECLKYAHKRDVLNLLRMSLHDLERIRQHILRRAIR